MSTLSVLALVPTIKPLLGNVPWRLVLGWISKESAGNLHSSGLASLDEAGYFQVTAEDSARLGFDHAKVKTDPATSVAVGLALINEYASKLSAQGIGGDFLWWLTKFRHGIGPGATQTLLNRFQDDNDRMPADAEEFKAYAIDQGSVSGHSTAKWSDETDAVWDDGLTLAKLAGLVTPWGAILGITLAAGIAYLLLSQSKARGTST